MSKKLAVYVTNWFEDLLIEEISHAIENNDPKRFKNLKFGDVFMILGDKRFEDILYSHLDRNRNLAPEDHQFLRVVIYWSTCEYFGYKPDPRKVKFKTERPPTWEDLEKVGG